MGSRSIDHSSDQIEFPKLRLYYLHALGNRKPLSIHNQLRIQWFVVQLLRPSQILDTNLAECQSLQKAPARPMSGHLLNGSALFIVPDTALPLDNTRLFSSRIRSVSQPSSACTYFPGNRRDAHSGTGSVCRLDPTPAPPRVGLKV
jgi:hypothetical protein